MNISLPVQLYSIVNRVIALIWRRIQNDINICQRINNRQNLISKKKKNFLRQQSLFYFWQVRLTERQLLLIQSLDLRVCVDRTRFFLIS